MVASFDAIMDSLEDTTELYSQRLEDLIQRCEQSGRGIESMKQLSETGNALRIRSPATFPMLGSR